MDDVVESKRQRLEALASTGNLDHDKFIALLLSLGEELSCSICKSLFNNPQLLPCSHDVCYNCVYNLVSKDEIIKCPLCRSSISKRKVKKNQNLENIVTLYRQLVTTDDTVEITQVSSFSQSAKQIAECLFVSDVETLESPSKEGNLNASIDEVTPPKPLSMIEEIKKMETPIIPFQYALKALEINENPKVDEATPLKGVVVTTTPPTFRLDPIVTAVTPLQQQIDTTTPPTVRLDDGKTPPTIRLEDLSSTEGHKNKRFQQDEISPIPIVSVQADSPSIVLGKSPQFEQNSKIPLERKADEFLPISGEQLPKLIDRSDSFIEADTSTTTIIEENAQRDTSTSQLNGQAEQPPKTETLNVIPPLKTKSTAKSKKKSPTSSQKKKKLLKEKNDVKPDEINEKSITAGTNPPQKDPFRVGAVVTVSRRMGPGQNKPGGVAIVKKKNEDGTIDVRYSVEGTRELHVDLKFVVPGRVMNSDSLFGKPSETVSNSATVTPATKKKEKSVLSTATRQLSFSSESPSISKKPMIVMTGSFSDKSRQKLKKQIENLEGIVSDGTDWSKVTHVVTTCVRKGEYLLASIRSFKFLKGLSLGLWIVDESWITQSKEKGEWVNEKEYEVDGDVTSAEIHGLSLGGPKRAREDRLNKLKLFSGYEIAFAGEYEEYKGIDFCSIVSSCGGKIVNVESLLLEKKSASKKKKKMKTVIICQDLEAARQFTEIPDERFIEISWIVNSIATYKVLEPNSFFCLEIIFECILSSFLSLTKVFRIL